METEDLPDTDTERFVKERVALVFENYTLEQVLEMNDLTEEDAIVLLFMEGHISEPEAYFP